MKQFVFPYRNGEWVAIVTAENYGTASVLLHRALNSAEDHPQVVFSPGNTHDEFWGEPESEEETE